MSFLFQINGNSVYPQPETLLVYPFNEIWERDTSPKKEVAIKEMGYIEFSVSMLKSNPYREYNEDRKDSVLKQEVVRIQGWEPDDLVKEGIEFIRNKQKELISYRYWESNKKAIEKMIEFFNEFDINEKNLKTLNPIYKPKDITGAVIDAEKTLSMINALKAKVDEEVYDTLKTKADKVISPFAKPGSLK